MYLEALRTQMFFLRSQGLPQGDLLILLSEHMLKQLEQEVRGVSSDIRSLREDLSDRSIWGMPIIEAKVAKPLVVYAPGKFFLPAE